MRPAKTQISLGVRPVWTQSSLSAWRKLWSLATHWVHSEDSDRTGRVPRLSWVFAGCTCHFVGFVMRRLVWFSDWQHQASLDNSNSTTANYTQSELIEKQTNVINMINRGSTSTWNLIHSYSKSPNYWKRRIRSNNANSDQTVLFHCYVPYAKQCRRWSNTADRGFWSGSLLFAHRISICGVWSGSTLFT